MSDDVGVFAQRLQAGGWTVKYLARAFDVPARTAERWLKGETRLPGHAALALDEAEHLGLLRQPPARPEFAQRMSDGGWSVAYLARALNKAEMTVRRWKSGEGGPPPHHVYLAIATAERLGLPRNEQMREKEWRWS